MLVESFCSFKNFGFCLDYISPYSVGRKHQKIQEITLTSTKIEHFAQFGIFVYDSGSRQLQINFFYFLFYVDKLQEKKKIL